MSSPPTTIEQGGRGHDLFRRRAAEARGRGRRADRDHPATTTSLKLGRRSNSQGFKNGALHDFRLYDRELSPSEVARLAKDESIRDLLAITPDKRSRAQNDTLLRFYLEQADAKYGELQEKVAALRRERDEIRKRGATTLVMDERKERPFAHILKRGEYDMPRRRSSPPLRPPCRPWPRGCRPTDSGWPAGSCRPEHPLSARVSINRFWQEVFGVGIVETAGSFGTMGQLPSHPELLDWLAVEFRESGWDVQPHDPTDGELVRDLPAELRRAARRSYAGGPRQPPGSSRGPRFRMDAEVIRDQALAASGLLVPEIGGPSVKTLPATRCLVRGRLHPIQHGPLHPRQRRQALPPQPLHLLEAHRRPALDGGVQRALPRELHHAPRTHPHPTPGADPDERPAVRRSRPAPRRQRHRRLWRRLARPRGPHGDAGAGPALRQARARDRRTVAGHLPGRLQGRRRSRRGAALRGRFPTARRRRSRARTRGAWTMVANQILNLDEAITKD